MSKSTKRKHPDAFTSDSDNGTGAIQAPKSNSRETQNTIEMKAKQVCNVVNKSNIGDILAFVDDLSKRKIIAPFGGAETADAACSHLARELQVSFLDVVFRKYVHDLCVDTSNPQSMEVLRELLYSKQPSDERSMDRKSTRKSVCNSLQKYTSILHKDHEQFYEDDNDGVVNWKAGINDLLDNKSNVLDGTPLLNTRTNKTVEIDDIEYNPDLGNQIDDWLIENIGLSWLMVSSQRNSKTFGNWNQVSELGSGMYGEVFLYQNMKTNKYVAMKRISKRQAKYKVINEAQILMKINSKCQKFLLCFDRAFLHVPGDYWYLSTEFLENYVVITHEIKNECQNLQKDLHVFSTAMVNMILATQLMHNQGVAHTDLHFENVMINIETGDIKIIDFGLADYVPNQWMTDSVKRTDLGRIDTIIFFCLMTIKDRESRDIVISEMKRRLPDYNYARWDSV